MEAICKVDGRGCLMEKEAMFLDNWWGVKAEVDNRARQHVRQRIEVRQNNCRAQKRSRTKQRVRPR
jgi:hypothetical protein